jgi:hypothetical protein
MIWHAILLEYLVLNLSPLLLWFLIRHWALPHSINVLPRDPSTSPFNGNRVINCLREGLEFFGFSDEVLPQHPGVTADYVHFPIRSGDPEDLTEAQKLKDADQYLVMISFLCVDGCQNTINKLLFVIRVFHICLAALDEGLNFFIVVVLCQNQTLHRAFLKVLLLKEFHEVFVECP